LVILLLLIYLVVIWNLPIGLVALKKPFRLVRNFIPWQNAANLCFCPQLFQLLVFIPSNKFEVSCRFTMVRDGAYQIFPAPVVSSNSSDYWAVYKFFASQSHHKLKKKIFFRRCKLRSKLSLFFFAS
jgi:hypothetical protein